MTTKSDKYVPISWPEAFELVGSTLQGLDSPHQASFYTSGRLSNEATFLYQLWVREFGTNNLPDCSNMCHEASGRALTASLGTGKGTCDLDDWEKADLLLVMGVNAASNAPRMLTSLAEAHRRGAQIVHINPLIEAASRRTIVPHEFLAMGTLHATKTGTMNVQPRVGGDLALLRGVAKVVLERAETDPKAIDREFLQRYTTDFEAYRSLVEATGWAEIVHQSGVEEKAIRELAEVYLGADRTVVAWCLGLTQQEHGVDTVREIVNLLLLRGNLGREGAGPSPVRGHSNVQGNRTCGIDHRPPKLLLDRLEEVCSITPPREHGLDTVGTIQAMLTGEVKVFVSMGGNFSLATPDTATTFAALRNCELTVQVSTKLNRSHLVHGRQALILPCLGRTEKDVQQHWRAGRHRRGFDEHGAPVIRDENPRVTAPEVRVRDPGRHGPGNAAGLRHTVGVLRRGLRPDPRRHGQGVSTASRTSTVAYGYRSGFGSGNPRASGSSSPRPAAAEFSCAPMPDVVPPPGRLTLGTVRSHDQWNTTIYSDNDRYRGVKNLRTALFMNADDMRERGLDEFDLIDITSFARDGSTRSVYGYRAVAYNTPPRQRDRLHARAERAVRDRGPQCAERPAVDQTPHRRGHPGRHRTGNHSHGDTDRRWLLIRLLLPLRRAGTTHPRPVPPLRGYSSANGIVTRSDVPFPA